MFDTLLTFSVTTKFPQLFEVQLISSKNSSLFLFYYELNSLTKQISLFNSELKDFEICSLRSII